MNKTAIEKVHLRPQLVKRKAFINQLKNFNAEYFRMLQSNIVFATFFKKLQHPETESV